MLVFVYSPLYKAETSEDFSGPLSSDIGFTELTIWLSVPFYGNGNFLFHFFR